MAVWDAFLSERDKTLRELYGSKAAGWGKRPVVLVVDINYNFTGREREPILESIKKWRSSCGAEGWDAAVHTGELLAVARKKRIPVLYTTEVDQRADGWDSGRWTDKNARRTEDRVYDRQAAEVGGLSAIGPGYLPRTNKAMHPAIQPRPEDILIGKYKPSAFFGTLLASYLVDLGADSIILAGSTTSGCVRATVIDGFSYNYRMFLVEECVFDRFEASHAINLFDMNTKYADVISLAATIRYLEALPDSLFEGRMPKPPAGADGGNPAASAAQKAAARR